LQAAHRESDHHHRGAMTSPSRCHAAEILHDPHRNKGTAFTEAERDALGLRGLLPPRVFTMAEQQIRVMGNFRQKTTDLEKYIFMTALLDRNETLFYRTVVDHIEEMLPIIYTPTVGEACLKYSPIFRRPRGLYVSAEDRGRVRDVLCNWPERKVAVIVVTDGERILGLGDLGAQGMGIPTGKLSLYTACGGVDPIRCLPVTLDVGTNNEQLLRDPLYIGLLRERLRGTEYDDLVEEFMSATQELFPGVLIQLEDFATGNAFRLLSRYGDRACLFNDDIQGTAAVTLAGLLSAGRVTGRQLRDQMIVFLGAGEAATGIANLVTASIARDGTSLEEARRRCWFVDTEGLVVHARDGLQPHKRPYAHDYPFIPDLLGVVEALHPTVLIGVSGQGQAFTEPVLRAMAVHHLRPIVFALSNPTSKSECTAEQAYRWTEGRGLFASGSPFGPVRLGNDTVVPGQANNAYVFPGIGLGVMAVGARRVTEEMFQAAAGTLAGLTTEASLARGTLFPPLRDIRQVSHAIAVEVAEVAYRAGLASMPEPADLAGHIRESMYEPDYRSQA
jgi:malate dehydrogenase (oxaloacetate-decarboxylating)(NADP+)